MKRIHSAMLSVTALFAIGISNPALAGDAGNGARVFAANCSSCHAGGKNLVNSRKTLKKADLEQYGMYSEAAIISQVTDGKNAMPTFKGRLKPAQIEDVAAYVMERAGKDWK